VGGDIPAGHVLVAIQAQKHEKPQRRAAGPRCAP
jgi:hypothetical protein